MDNRRDGEVYEKTIAAVCASVLCIILIAGLWPFHAAPNDVVWLPHENGLYFGKYGNILSPGKFQAHRPGDDGSRSIEIWLKPRLMDVSTILAFTGLEDSGVPFALRQYYDGLILERHAAGRMGVATKSTFELERVFRGGTSALVTITSGKQGTSVYVDGVLEETSPTFRLSSEELSGQLILANSSTSKDNWSGEIKGLAIYARQLTPAQVAKHYENWTTKHQSGDVLAEAPVALYLFNEGRGNLVHNQVDSGTNLVIPARYFVLHPPFLALPWKEYYPGWDYWEDILINICGFIPFGFSVVGCLSSVHRSDQPGATTMVLGFVTSLSIEALQTLLPTRSSGMTDLMTNTLGTAIGVMCYRLPITQTLLTSARQRGCFSRSGNLDGKPERRY